MSPSRVSAQPGHATIPETVRTLAGFQKSNKGAPVYSRFVNRPLGRWFAATAYHLGLTPNQVTGLSALCSFAGIALILLTTPGPLLGVLIALLLVLGYALDSADGQLARLRGGGSPAGEWLDHVVDCAKISSLHLAVLGALAWHTDLDRRWLLVPALYVLVANMFFFTFILTDLLRRVRGGVRPAAAGGQASIVRSIASAPTDYGLLCVAFLLFGWPALFVPLYGLFMIGTAAYVLLGMPKWFRDIDALGSAPAPGGAS